MDFDTVSLTTLRSGGGMKFRLLPVTVGVGFMRFIFATPRPIMEQAVLQMAAAL